MSDMRIQGAGPCHEVLIALRRIIRAVDLHSRFLVQRHGLTGPQLILLQEIAAGHETAVGDLARRVSLSAATVTNVLDRIERRGLVERRRSESDKRRVLVRATRAGLEMLLKSPPLLQQRFVSEFESLADWEQSQILSSLQRIAAMMDASQLDAAPLLSTGSITASGAAAADQSSSPPQETDAVKPDEIRR